MSKQTFENKTFYSNGEEIKKGDIVFLVKENRIATILNDYKNADFLSFGEIRTDVSGNVNISDIEKFDPDNGLHSQYVETFQPIKPEWCKNYDMPLSMIRDLPLPGNFEPEDPVVLSMN